MLARAAHLKKQPAGPVFAPDQSLVQGRLPRIQSVRHAQRLVQVLAQLFQHHLGIAIREGIAE